MERVNGVTSVTSYKKIFKKTHEELFKHGKRMRTYVEIVLWDKINMSVYHGINESVKKNLEKEFIHYE